MFRSILLVSAAVLSLASSGAYAGNSSSIVQNGNGNGVPLPAGSAKSRAADDPLVQYFQQKFDAEIRTVIDQRKN